MTDAIDLMLRHRSIRRFADRPVEEAHLRAAIAAGQAASTSSHIQAYSAIRVTDEETRARLATAAGGQRQVSECGAFLVICGDVRRHRIVCSDAGEPCVENLESFLVATIDAAYTVPSTDPASVIPTDHAITLLLRSQSPGSGTSFISARIAATSPGAHGTDKKSSIPAQCPAPTTATIFLHGR